MIPDGFLDTVGAMNPRLVATPWLLLLLASACSSPSGESAPSAKALSAAPRSASARPAPAASSAASTAAPTSSSPTPPAPPVAPQSAYAPLPKVVACDACKRPGTGCVTGTTDTCALDPEAYWSIEVDRFKGTPIAEGMPVCFLGACGSLSEKKEGAWTLLSEAKAATVSTAALLGLAPFELSELKVSALEGPVRVDEALFDAGVVGSDSAGQVFRLKLKPGQKPSDAPAALVTLSPAKTPLAEKHPAAFAKAEQIAKLAAGIDAKLATYKRALVHTYRASGFGIPMVGFYDGATLVKVAAILPYTPPTLMSSYYFDQGRLVLERGHAYDFFDDQGNQREQVSTGYYEGDQLVWSDQAEFDPLKSEPRDTRHVADDLTKAFKDAKHRVDSI